MDKKPVKWRSEFKDFPKVPDSKIWKEDGPFTPEQLAIQKLIYNKELTQLEENELKEAIAFYKNIIAKYQELDFESLSDKEFEEFKEYFNYAFNHLVYVKNDLFANEVVRLVRNESVLGKKERIRWQKDLSYPPLETVKRNQIYNRANTPEFNLFYACTSIDSSLKEIKPAIGETVTVGIWRIDNAKIPLISYPICHNPSAIEVNDSFARGKHAFEKLRPERNELLMEFMETIFVFLSNEYAKPITNPKHYFVSAKYSDRILNFETGPDFIYDCIVYPSVGDAYSSDCLAILPKVIDKRYRLVKVIEFEITGTNYSDMVNPKTREEINLVQFKNLSSTDWIEKNGYIVWD